MTWHPSLYSHRQDDPTKPETTDDAPYTPRSVVADPFFDWAGDRPPATALSDTVIYEAHVKGATFRHPEIEPELRGTYSGLAHPAFLAHLERLRVTAIELMPVHQFVHDPRLVAAGLRNYWGYNSIGFLAPHDEYGSRPGVGEQVQEFKSMVRTLHDAGHRGHPRRRLQPHRRGQPPRSDAHLQGHRQPGLLPADAERPHALHGLHGHRELAEHAQPPHAAADHGQPALLGQRDARRRLPVRPGGDAGPGAARGRPAVGLLRPHPAGPGHQPGQAHRRAVGRG